MNTPPVFFLTAPCLIITRRILPGIPARWSAPCPPPLPWLGSSRVWDPLEQLKREENKEKKRRQRSLYWASSANPAGHLFCHTERQTNTISCQLRSQSERRGNCRFFHPKDCAGFIPLRRKKELNWVDTHYWKRMGVQRVGCAGSEIRDTQRANSLVLVWTAAPRWLSFLQPETKGHSGEGNRKSALHWKRR